MLTAKWAQLCLPNAKTNVIHDDISNALKLSTGTAFETWYQFLKLPYFNVVIITCLKEFLKADWCEHTD